MIRSYPQINGSTVLKLGVTHVPHAALCCRYIWLSENTKNICCPQMVLIGQNQGAGLWPKGEVKHFYKLRRNLARETDYSYLLFSI